MHRGSLYKTFGSKRGLYLRALRRHIDHDVAALAKTIAAGGSADEVRRVLPAGHDLGLLFLAMVERAPVDAEVAAATTRALGLLDGATDSQQVTNQAIGLLLRGRTTAVQEHTLEGIR